MATLQRQNPLLRVFWTVYPTVTLLAEGNTLDCIALLLEATKPSTNRLHHRDLFIQGMRYYIEPRTDGFQMLTNSKHYWRYTEGLLRIQRRTRSATRLQATLEDLTSGYTRIQLRAHFRPLYLLDVLWLPLFFTTIIVPLAWPPALLAGISGVLFALSFLYHRFNASYQANEMIYFVEKVLEDRLVTSLPTLSAAGETPTVMNPQQAFETEWERFYRAHAPKEE
jgi:hypothetical protein